MTSSRVVISGAFDDLRPPNFRFLSEAAKLGKVLALLWSDDAIKKLTGKTPKFPHQERLYLLESVRYIDKAIIINETTPEILLQFKPEIWAVDEQNDNAQNEAFCNANKIKYKVLKNSVLNSFPDYVPDFKKTVSARKKVIVTGCYDWFHSGHVRFFEEASQLGDLYVCIGSDRTIAQLKGPGHPLIPQQQRWFVVQSIKFVKQTLISTGFGWLDAEPEMRRLEPDIYVVNEDGDKPEKREFCRAHGLEYVVLKRAPKAGLPRRQSTDLRGF